MNMEYLQERGKTFKLSTIYAPLQLRLLYGFRRYFHRIHSS